MNIIWFKHCSYKNKNLVGGKNASLGELYHLSKKFNFNIADGFALSVDLYNNFIQQNKFLDQIKLFLRNIDNNNIEQLQETSTKIKNLIKTGTFIESQKLDILDNFNKLKLLYKNNLEVAVRSSAIAEDLPNASFAGQQDTYLNIQTFDDLLESIIDCYASLFNARAISYRHTNNIQFSDVKMSVAIQKMVRSDIASAGVAFSLDPETGYKKAIIINSSYGLGELVVSGGVKPDEFIVDKRVLKESKEDPVSNYNPIIDKKIGDKTTKIIYDEKMTKEIETSLVEKNSYSLTNEQIILLASWIIDLEKEYSYLLQSNCGIDIEWALDGIDNKIYIIQSRPETVHTNSNELTYNKYVFKDTAMNKNTLLEGVSVGKKISHGEIKYLKNISEHMLFNDGDILVTSMTTPDWEPIMKKSSGIITDKGGRTCHAAIVARELGINAIVGTTNGTSVLINGQCVTMSCAEGEIGKVYTGTIPYHIEKYNIEQKKSPKTKLMMNVGSPENAFISSLLPHQGIGLARLEFIINNDIKIHPLALLDYDNTNDDTDSVKEEIKAIISLENQTPVDYFVQKLARGIGKIASAFYPEPVIVRFSDFKSNEYKNLLGGSKYEPEEENPMLGWRGASRYYSKEYSKAFDLECQAIHYVRETMNMKNVVVMIPFCRTPEECKKVLDILLKNGLKREKDGLKVFLMCEIPSNVIQADEFAPLIDGVSIGGNDLLQLTLGIDRDSDKISNLSDHTNNSYRRMITQAITTYKNYGVKIGFCGQQPSDSLEFAQFLINRGIDSISVIPDTFIEVYNKLL